MKNAAHQVSHLFYSILLLLIHVGCFICCTSNNNNNHHNNSNDDDDNNYLKTKKRRKSSTPFNISPQKAISSSWSYIKKVFSSKKNSPTQTSPDNATNSFCSPRTSKYSNLENDHSDRLYPRKRRSGSESESEFESSSLYENPLLPLRNDIYPCPACGEIFHKPNVLEQHQATKHAVSELREGDSGKNIVWIIFKTGWEMEKQSFPKIHRILKIHNGKKILSRFEDYREIVKARAARNAAALRRDERTHFLHERCIVDGNELLRFHCTTFVCSLGQNGNSSVCNQHYCSACGVIRAGFSPKLDGISTLSTSWRAHVSVPGDVEAEFAFMNVKRAMLVCRVIAGRVGCDPMIMEVDKEDQGYDSLVGRGVTSQGKIDEDELLVFNPRAVLPCFVIVYSV